ncbi:MAG: hypothetical protein QG671_3949 [Actinomycetota bacterium]|nr:hypothetical protein [Actinomycetota bacterium]
MPDTDARSDVTEGLPLGTKLLAGSFVVSGLVHLGRPQVFEPLIPPGLGAPRPWVVTSGVAELACAAGLLTRQRWAPRASASLLAGVWVGNWWMAINATRKRGRAPITVVSWLRVPLQLPMIRVALRSPVKNA